MSRYNSHNNYKNNNYNRNNSSNERFHKRRYENERKQTTCKIAFISDSKNSRLLSRWDNSLQKSVIKTFQNNEIECIIEIVEWEKFDSSKWQKFDLFVIRNPWYFFLFYFYYYFIDWKTHFNFFFRFKKGLYK